LVASVRRQSAIPPNRCPTLGYQVSINIGTEVFQDDQNPKSLRRSRLIRGRVPRLAKVRAGVPRLSDAGGMSQRFQSAKRFGMVNGGFILKPDFDRPAGKFPWDCGARPAGKVFFKARCLEAASRVHGTPRHAAEIPLLR
jgi:hypothetical protein